MKYIKYRKRKSNKLPTNHIIYLKHKGNTHMSIHTNTEKSHLAYQEHIQLDGSIDQHRHVLYRGEWPTVYLVLLPESIAETQYCCPSDLSAPSEASIQLQ